LAAIWELPRWQALFIVVSCARYPRHAGCSGHISARSHGRWASFGGFPPGGAVYGSFSRTPKSAWRLLRPCQRPLVQLLVLFWGFSWRYAQFIVACCARKSVMKATQATAALDPPAAGFGLGLFPPAGAAYGSLLCPKKSAWRLLRPRRRSIPRPLVMF